MVAIHHINEVVFVCVLKGDEVCIHETADETFLLDIGILFLVVRFLLEGRVWVDAKVR